MDHPYRSDTMNPEEEVAYLHRLLSSAEARLQATRGTAESVSFTVQTGEVADLLSNWQTFYRDLFGLELDFSKLQIPPKYDGFDQLIVVAKGMTPERIYAQCQKLFDCWKYTNNLDTVISDRDPSKMGTYAIWVRDRVEAGEELKNQSANELAKSGIKGMTLPERLLHELKYFKETGKHLDVKNITLCSGSRNPHGDVPNVRWRAEGGGMGVYWSDPGYRSDDLRARAAVTL